MRREPPAFFKATLEDIEREVAAVRKGTVQTVSSAGGRKIQLVCYGKKNDYRRTANLSSAAGYGDSSCYADKARPEVKPCLLLVGAMHGAEFEGTSAILNLIHVIETGQDYAGNPYPSLTRMAEEMNLLLIPCLNPDGRARVPFQEVTGMSFEEFRYWAQGTWKDGSLAGWPDCKKIHPILAAAGHLGAYYNDDGVNLMHDDFFAPMAGETKFLLDTVGEYVPDLTILLHGGTNAPNLVINPSGVPLYFKTEARRFALNLDRRCRGEGLKTRVQPINASDTNPPVSVNAAAAVTLKCGELCVTYETNQGLDYGDLIYDAAQIYRHHILLFEAAADYVRELRERRISAL